jgi:hypothetical protein
MATEGRSSWNVGRGRGVEVEVDVAPAASRGGGPGRGRGIAPGEGVAGLTAGARR